MDTYEDKNKTQEQVNSIINSEDGSGIRPEALGHRASHERVYDVKLSEWDTWALLEAIDEQISNVMDMDANEEWREMYIASLRELERMLGSLIQEVQQEPEAKIVGRDAYDYWH